VRVGVGCGYGAVVGEHGEEVSLNVVGHRSGHVHHQGVRAFLQGRPAGVLCGEGHGTGIGAPAAHGVHRGEGQYTAAAVLARHDGDGHLGVLVLGEPTEAFFGLGGHGDHGDEYSRPAQGGQDLPVPHPALGVFTQPCFDGGVGTAVGVAEVLGADGGWAAHGPRLYRRGPSTGRWRLPQVSCASRPVTGLSPFSTSSRASRIAPSWVICVLESRPKSKERTFSAWPGAALRRAVSPSSVRTAHSPRRSSSQCVRCTYPSCSSRAIWWDRRLLETITLSASRRMRMRCFGASDRWTRIPYSMRVSPACARRSCSSSS